MFKFPVTRDEWDAVFPTLVRYIGVGLVVVFTTASLVGIRLPEALLIAASGMILYKNVHEGARGENGRRKNGGD